jgi:hypothetical protein
MVIEEGRYTGEIAYYVYGTAKADAVRELADISGYDLSESYAYSDSSTDLPMLEAVGYPHAVNPDRLLRKESIARGWPVLDFTNPVTLRSRLPRLPSGPAPVLTAAGIGAGVAAAGIVWYAKRRGRTRA